MKGKANRVNTRRLLSLQKSCRDKLIGIPERSGLQKYALYPLKPVHHSQQVDRRRDFYTLEEISLT